MSHRGLCYLASSLGFPRVSGDEPFIGYRLLLKDAFSPRERG